MPPKGAVKLEGRTSGFFIRGLLHMRAIRSLKYTASGFIALQTGTPLLCSLPQLSSNSSSLIFLTMAAEDASSSVMAMTAQGPEERQRAYLPQEARVAAAAVRDVAVQAVVGNVGAAALEKRRLDPAAAPVEVPARMVSPPLQAPK